MNGDGPRRRRTGWQPSFVQIPMPVMERFAELRRRGGRRDAFEIDSAFLTYAGLRSHRNNAKKSRDVGTARTSASEVAECTGQGARTVERNLPRLKEWGVVFMDPKPGAMTTFTFIDDPELYDKDAAESGQEQAKGIVERENEQVTQKARSEAAGDAARQAPPPHVADPTATRGGPPPPPVTPTPATRGAPVVTENFERSEKGGAPADAGVPTSLADQAAKINDNGNDPDRAVIKAAVAEIKAAVAVLAHAKRMPKVRTTEHGREARIAKLRRQTEGWRR